MVTPRTTRWATWGGLVAALLAATPAAAQQEDARRLFLQGRELAAEDDWEGALTRWRASFVLVERASTAISLAHAYVRLERYPEAMAALDDLERLADPAGDARLLESGAELRAEVRAAMEPEPEAEPEPEVELEPERESEGEVEPPVEPRTSGGFDVGSLIGPIALGGAALVAFGLQGGFFAISRDSVARRDALCASPTACPNAAVRSEAEAADQEAYDMTSVANAMMIAGVALAAGAVVWLIVALSTGGDERAVARWASEGVSF